MPRTISVIACVFAENSKNADLLRTYLELLARTPEEGIVEIGNEEEHAALAGFSPNQRGVRSWRERLKALNELGFIRTFGAARGIDQVVMVHPTRAMTALHKAGKVSARLWAQFCKVVVDTTGSAPDAQAVPLNDMFVMLEGTPPQPGTTETHAETSTEVTATK